MRYKRPVDGPRTVSRAVSDAVPGTGRSVVWTHRASAGSTAALARRLTAGARTGRRPFRRGWRRHVVDGVAAIKARPCWCCAPLPSNRHFVSRFLRTPWRSRSATRAVDTASLATGVALVRALAAFDADTAEHSATVALYARDVALHLGADGDSAAVIQLGALVHDVGKLSLPVDLLLKADPLDDDEWALMREHPEAGARILAGLPSSHTLLTIVRHHHERMDGAGYPSGLRGADIPAEARIVGACDAYASMTQPRPYRE